MIKFALLSIRIWQNVFSPDLVGGLSGFGRCRFYPSCSQYAAESIRQYGLRKGFMASLLRILRCNPWMKGGYDPVLENPKPETLNPKRV